MKEVITNDEYKCREALQALTEVLDPEIGLNIVDLGLVYQMDFDEANKLVFLSMTLTTQFCPMGESIRDHALAVIKNHLPGYTINIDIVFDPPWNPSMISDKGHEFLNREQRSVIPARPPSKPLFSWQQNLNSEVVPV